MATKKTAKRSARMTKGRGRNAKAEPKQTIPVTAAESGRDPRLPPVGTVLQKRDRSGQVRCECTIEEDGIRYDKTLFKSLSAAATAAAEDLKIKGNQNGFVFWQLVSPAGGGDQVERLEKLWERYLAAAKAVAIAASTDVREKGIAAIERHRAVELVQETR